MSLLSISNAYKMPHCPSVIKFFAPRPSCVSVIGGDSCGGRHLYGIVSALLGTTVLRSQARRLEIVLKYKGGALKLCTSCTSRLRENSMYTQTSMDSSLWRRCSNSLMMLKMAVQLGHRERRGAEVPPALRGAVRPSNGSWRTEKPLQ